MSVLVYNADGVNPYAAELASLLAGRERCVTLLDAANGSQAPAEQVRWRRVLPATYGAASRAGQAARLLRGTLLLLWRSGARADVVVVSWYRFTLEAVALAALAAARRPVLLVLHNPVSRVERSWLRRSADGVLERRARVVVVHSERLVRDVAPGVRDRVLVCPHPPYAQTSAASCAPALALDPERRWLAFVGNLRPDKGVGLVPDVLDLLSAAELARTGLVVCGAGVLPAGPWERLRRDGLAVVDLTADRPVPADVLLGVLRARPVVLAPYVAATQSGSVILALSLGCDVLAFDQGGLPDVVSDAGLVPTGDVAALAQAVREGRAGGPRQPLPAWSAHAAGSWSAAVATARGEVARPR